jgi:nickel/cobalt transporter (NiCoT) family protein
VSPRASVTGLYAGLLTCNALAWLASFLAFHRHPVLLGMAGLAYTLGLRHAVDADHIAAIDNATRKLMQAGQRPMAVGLYFSLGHSTVVLLASMVLVWTAGDVSARLDWLKADGTLVGTGVSVTFLLAIALLNLMILRSTYRALRRVRAGGTIESDNLPAPAVASGPLAKVFSPVFRLVARSVHMYPVGFLFGLGFDTATEVAVLGLAATEAGKGLDPRSILLFPALFAAGMALIDTLDSTLMVGAYGCALVGPAAKLRYNMTMTGISVLIAVAVGTVEAAGLLAQRLRLAGWPWDWVTVLNGNFAFLGYLIVGIFAVGWLVAVLVRGPSIPQ